MNAPAHSAWLVRGNTIRNGDMWCDVCPRVLERRCFDFFVNIDDR